MRCYTKSKPSWRSFSLQSSQSRYLPVAGKWIDFWLSRLWRECLIFLQETDMKKTLTFTLTLLLVLTLTACSLGGNAASPTTQTTINTTAASTAVPTVTTVAEALSEKSATHDDATDYVWDAATAIPITLNGDSITADSPGVKVDGSTVTIAAAGTYSLSGTLIDGQIVVETQSDAPVRLVLNGVSLTNSSSAPINIVKAEKTIIILADGTQNTVTDASNYIFASADVDEPNAAIFSKGDLTIEGTGSLTVNGNFNDGIASKDGLVIASGTITVNAVDDGIRGKDYLVVKNGTLTVNAGGDGLKSDNEEDATKGYISIENGVFNVTSGSDAFSAQTDLLIATGEFNLTTGGGSTASLAESASAKGLKALANLNIDSGSFTINAADDALHTNGNLVINTGTFNLASGDDGMHADATLTINGGEINVTDSYEGIESAVITINSGNIHVVASDDGINVASGVDGSGMMGRGGPGGGQQDTFNASSSTFLYIHGGSISVDARGDGVDVNGAIEMTDGVLIVNGPTEQMNGALDYDAGFKMTGGFIVAAGSSGMAMTPGAYSEQNSLLVFLTSTQPAGTLFHIQNSAGKDILTFAPTKSYQSVAFSSPKLVNGETYTIYLGGSSTGTATDGLYQGGTYTPGTQSESFTISSVVTQVGSGGQGGPGGGGRRP
jgi:hypothetical protein